MFIYTSQNMGLCNFYFVIVYNEPAIKLYYYYYNRSIIYQTSIVKYLFM